MPSLINTQPTGLLSVLGIKSVGQNPAVLSDLVQPVVNLDDAYGLGSSSYVQGSIGTLNTIGLNSAFPVVPAGEAWLVHEMGVQSIAVLAAATSYRLAPCVFSQGLNLNLYTGPMQSFIAGERVLFSTDRKVFVPAGFQLGLAVSALALGTATAILAFARISRLAV